MLNKGAARGIMWLMVFGPPVKMIAHPWYRTLDLKFNPVDSSHFESNFKRTKNCLTTRANTNEPSKRINYWRYSADSRIKKVGVLRGQGKK